MSNNWKDRIYDHEEMPPKGMWDSIAKELDKRDKPKAKVITLSKVRWAVAATVAIAVTVTAIYVFKSSSHDETMVAVETKKDTNTNASSSAQKNNSTVVQQPIDAEPKTSIAVIPVVKKKTNQLQKKENATDFTLPENIDLITANNIQNVIKDPITSDKTKLKNISGETSDDIALMDAPNSYVSFLGPNGQEVKVSSKFANIIGIMRNGDNQEYLDKVISESAYWKEKFSKWRNKMAETGVSPSPLNFFDIIELTKLLSEEK